MEKITSADGTTLAVDRTGSGPALVLVGGAFNDRSTVAGAADALAGSYTAWTYDRRGRGESGPLGPWPGGEAAVEAEIADLAAVVAAAGGDTVLVGHSSGAQLVLEAAARGLPARRVVAYECSTAGTAPSGCGPGRRPWPPRCPVPRTGPCRGRTTRSCTGPRSSPPRMLLWFVKIVCCE